MQDLTGIVRPVRSFLFDRRLLRVYTNIAQANLTVLVHPARASYAIR